MDRGRPNKVRPLSLQRSGTSRSESSCRQPQTPPLCSEATVGQSISEHLLFAKLSFLESVLLVGLTFFTKLDPIWR